MTIKTIGAKLKNVSKKFPKQVKKEQYLYREAKDLKETYSTVYVYAIIYDPDRGHSLFVWNPHRRGFDWNYKGWYRWLVTLGYTIMTDAVMDSINDKYGSRWVVKKIVGYHGAVYKPVYKAASEKRNKTDD